MTNLYKKIAVGIATAAALVNTGILIPVASAQIQVTISGNGDSSDNDVTIDRTNDNQVFQTNDSTITNTVNADAITGDNNANSNTGGDVTVDTGDADTFVTVTNVANSNSADIDSCGCPDDVIVDIDGNGANSLNTVGLTTNTTNLITQDNTANVTNDIDANSDTGGNDAQFNTGGSVGVTTGNSSADVQVVNDLNVNDVLSGGVNGGGTLDLGISGNGAFSDNDILIASTDNNDIFQTNDETLLNTVVVYADSGDNDVNSNTGPGTFSVLTGDTFAGALIDDAANFNSADVDSCCVESGTVDILENGSNSFSTVDLSFADAALATQDNVDVTTNDADANADSGGSNANNNTDGSVTETTGAALTDVLIENDTNVNYFSN